MYSAQLALCSDGCDLVRFRFALRTLSKGLQGPQNSVALLLNGEPVLQRGVLYQGYWPESLTALPSPQAQAAIAEYVQCSIV